MEGSKLYQLKKQLELAEMVVRLTHGHMWDIHTRDLCREAIKTQEAIKKEIEKEQKASIS